MSLRPRPPVAPGDSSRGRLQTVLLAGQSASTGSKFPITYNQLRAKVPVYDWITDRVAGSRGIWVLATIPNNLPKRQDLDYMFIDSGGDSNDQKQFRTYTYYLLPTDGKEEKVVNRYTKFLVEYEVGYTFMRVDVVNGRVAWKMVPGMKLSQVRGF